MAEPIWFKKADYLQSKLNQLHAQGETQYTNTVQVEQALQAAGFTAFEHFQAYSLVEGTSPNSYFNADEYLANKAAQMGNGWNANSVLLAIKDAGFATLYDHYTQYGWKEGVNPSSSFSNEVYLQAKLEQLQAAEPDADPAWETTQQVADAFAAAGVDPISHYIGFGQAEGLEIVGGGTGVEGQTFWLDVGRDLLVGENGGTAGDDVFQADVVQNALGLQSNTLGSGDRLDGGAGNDTLNAKLVAGGGVSGTWNQPIQPITNSIENVNVQAQITDLGLQSNSGFWGFLNDSEDFGMTWLNNDQVYLNAKEMFGVERLASNYSDGDLTVMNLTSIGVGHVSEMTVAMEYSGNADSRWDESDFSVYFDQDYLTPGVSLTKPTIEFIAMNEDAYDLDPARPLEGVFFRELQFTLNGEVFDLVPYMDEDPAGAGTEIITYDDFVAKMQEAVEALKADNRGNEALQSVTVRKGGNHPTDLDPTGIPRIAQSVLLDVEGETNGVANELEVAQTDLEVARTANATVPNNNRYERAEAVEAVELDELLSINVELEKVGLAGDGGALVIGSMNKTSANEWDAVNTTVDSTVSGIQEFNVTVNGDNSKSSSLSGLHSTNNNLQVVTVKSEDALGRTSFADLTIGNSNSGIGESVLVYDYDQGGDVEFVQKFAGYENALKDVQIFDASAFNGDLTLYAALTDEIADKYLNLRDGDPALAGDDNVEFVYTGGNGNDEINLTISATNFDREGNVTREDMSVEVNGGNGNDIINVAIIDQFEADSLSSGDVTVIDLADPFDNWYDNQQQLFGNLSINGGDGDDTVTIFGSGDWLVDLGTGNDTIYASHDDWAESAVWVFNATDAELNDMVGGGDTQYAGTLYKSQVTVSFEGFESTVTIGNVNANSTREVNQAIKAAINGDAVLNKLIVAEDGPADSLVVRALVNGQLDEATLSVTLAAPDATDLTTADVGAYNAAHGVSLTTAGLAALIADGVADFDADAIAEFEFAQGDFGDIDGEDSWHIGDTTITAGLGNDVIVLGTNYLASQETLVYEGFGNGVDSILNFEAGAGLATETVIIEPAIPASVATAEVVTLTFSETDGTVATPTIIFDGITVTLAAPSAGNLVPAADVAKQFAELYTAAVGAKTWSVTNYVPGENTVEITSVTSGVRPDLASADFTGTYNGTVTPVVDIQGVDGYVAAEEAEFTVAFDTTATAATADGTFVFDGVTVNYLAGDGSLTLAQKLADASFPNWTTSVDLSAADPIVTFTANEAGEQDLTATGLDIATAFATGNGVTTTVTTLDSGADQIGTAGVPAVTEEIEIWTGYDLIDFESYDVNNLVVVHEDGATDWLYGGYVNGQNYIALFENEDNVGEYSAGVYTANTTIGVFGDDATVGLIGTLDFGAHQAFVAENFII